MGELLSLVCAFLRALPCWIWERRAPLFGWAVGAGAGGA